MLNQAWHPHWSVRPGRISRHEGGNLAITLNRRDLTAQAVTIELVFHDDVSERGTRVSVVAWPVALGLILLLLLCANLRVSPGPPTHVDA